MRFEKDRFNLLGQKPLVVEKDESIGSKKNCKKGFYLPLKELLDGVGDEAKQFDLP